MVEAIFRVDAFRGFACRQAATEGRRIVVDVDIAPRFAAGETCASDVFAIYRPGQPTNTDAVLRLAIWQRDAQTWEFGASFFDPPSSPDDSPTAQGGFDDNNYYCALGDGRLARTDRGWRASIAHSK